jgi:hypothetical protein
MKTLTDYILRKISFIERVIQSTNQIAKTDHTSN